MVKPIKGDALMFYGMDEQNVYRVEESLHEGCPVINGEKWSATIWVRQGDRGRDPKDAEPVSQDTPYYNY